MTRESAVVRYLRALASRRFFASLIVALLLASCATAPQQPTAYPGRASDTGDDRVMTGILTAISLPLFIPFKAAVCALTVVIAAPATAVYTVTDPEGKNWIRRELSDGFATNCGNWLPSF